MQYIIKVMEGGRSLQRALIIVALLASSAFFMPAGMAKAQNVLIRSTPEAEGLSSKHLKAFFDRLMSESNAEVHSCIVMRHGHVIGEIYPRPWRADYRHTMYSVSKTFTSVAVGMCVADSLLSLDDSVGKFFPLLLPSECTDTVSAITVRDLLTMQSGLPVDTKMRTREREWIRMYLGGRPKGMPGTLWAYDSLSSYLLSAIVQEVTDSTLMQLLRSHLFHPMGITDAAWEESPEGVTCGGWGLYIRPEAMAKFGQLLLDGGRWNGVELVPRQWVEEMMKPQSITGKYGYQMWQSAYPGWVEANGSYGQLILIIPEADMVVTLTQCNSRRVPVKQWVKQFLVDNLQPHALPEAWVRKDFNHYSLPTAKGGKRSTGHVLPADMNLENNALAWERLALRTEGDLLLMEVTDEEGQRYVIRLTNDRWEESEISGRPYCNPKFINNFSNLPSVWHVAGSYGWNEDGSLNIRLHWTDWLTSARLKIHFAGASTRISFTPTETGKTSVFKAWSR